MKPTTTKTIDLWSYKDASDTLKDIILEKHRYLNVEHDDWSEYCIELQAEEMEEHGFVSPEIRFSGFSSQGDGACFDIKSFDAGRYIKENTLQEQFPLITKYPEAIFGYIRENSHSHHYCHSNTRYFELNIEETELPETMATEFNEYEKEASAFEKHVEQTREELSNSTYSNLSNVYYSHLEDDSVADMLEANEYLFDENGDIS